MPRRNPKEATLAEQIAHAEDWATAHLLKAGRVIERLLGRLDWHLGQGTRDDWGILDAETKEHHVRMAAQLANSAVKVSAEVLRIRKHKAEELDALSSEEIEALIREAVEGRHGGTH